jgi:hypothetical protein
MKIFAHLFHFGHISGSSLGEFLSHFCFVSSRLGGRFLAFYTFIFVFQAYLVASLEARLSHLFGFGYGNLGGHLSRAHLRDAYGLFSKRP